MDSSINQTNQTNQPIASMQEFESFVSKFTAFLTMMLTTGADHTIAAFLVAFQQFTTAVYQVVQATNSNNMATAFATVLDKDPGFRTSYAAFHTKYQAFIDVKEMETSSANTGSVFANVLTLPAQTVFTTSSQPMDIEYTAIHVAPTSNNIHVVVDGLNFWCRMTEFLNSRWEEFCFMNVDRVSAQHQFDCECEITRAFEQTIIFFRKVVPAGAKIHIVVKPFGSDWLWASFLRLFNEMFMIPGIGHIYRLYSSIAATCNNYCDKECDDRLVLKLAALLQRNKNNRVNILSRDQYRSIQQHWDLPSYYEVLTANPTKTYELLEDNIGGLDNVTFVEFAFRAQRCAPNPAILDVSTDRPICV